MMTMDFVVIVTLIIISSHTTLAFFFPIAIPGPLGDCPHGYKLNDGDIPGWGTNLGSGMGGYSREACADACDAKPRCLSFEHSHSEHKCNLNDRSMPNRGRHFDYAFCTKPGPCPAGQYLKRHASQCSRCEGNTFSSETGNGACKACPPGTVPNAGKTECTFECTCAETGQKYGGGEFYMNDNGAKCICGSEGFVCLCDDADVTCAAGTTKWTDQNTCKAKCIKNAAYCSSTGDPHYLSFDGKYYDFHGQCTYQAASCDDFVVYFKNVDLLGRAPRFTKRAELRYKGKIFTIENGYRATVDGQQVQTPYVKTYTTGDSVRILNNGQLEIVLYQNSKGRIPAVRIRATNSGNYIHAEMWLHGSCSDETEGMCGNWNGDSADDVPGGSSNALGNLNVVYDENCPAPPAPYHPCDEVDNGYADAAAICNALKQAPFTSCHSVVSCGDKDGGIYKNCMTDVCNCFMDKNCACSQYDNYASSCIQAGIDLSNWRQDVSYCPYECPDGLAYIAAASTPAPTCLNKNPEQEGTARGCFCPSGQFLQDGVCVDESKCRCIYEGKFYNVGDDIKKEGECQTCTCQAGGNMDCQKLSCPSITCAGNEIQAEREDLCCPYCDADWVKAVNPDVVVKKGQKVVLTCDIQAKGVLKKDISWFKDGDEITKGISKNRLILKVAVADADADADAGGVYTCQAVKNGKTGKATFKVEVKTPVVPNVNIKPVKSIITCKAKGKKKSPCIVQFKVTTNDGTKIDKKKVQICKLSKGKITKCKRAGGTAPNFKRTLPKKSAAGNYVCVVTHGGKKFTSEAMTVKGP